MNLEIWKSIPGYEDIYEASNHGNVRSIDRKIRYSHTGRVEFRPGKVLIITTNKKHGYSYVSLSKNGIAKTHRVHKLVLWAFKGKHSNTLVINHINGIKSDNRLINIEVCTQSQNLKHSHKVLGNMPHNKGKIGKYGKAVIVKDRNGKMLAEYPNANCMSKDGFNHRHVNECCNGKRKSHRNLLYTFKYADNV